MEKLNLPEWTNIKRDLEEGEEEDFEQMMIMSLKKINEIIDVINEKGV